MAVGAIAVSAGLLPSPNGSGGYAFPGSNAAQVQAGGQSENAGVQGGESAAGTRDAADRGGGAAGRAPAATPSLSASPSSSAPTALASVLSSSATASSTSSEAANSGNRAEEQVLALVNAERAKIGCAALIADPDLGKLADAFSKDMAKRDFFDHTDPDGNDPWDRAAAADITGLGGENIARGQPDPESVMDAWMNSPGHRANILNCNFKTIGVGVFFAGGGPWWTQDFGY